MAHNTFDPLGANESFVLAEFDDGAVLFDLSGGAFFRLNRSAIPICRGLVRGQSAESLIREHAAGFALDSVQAGRDVNGVLAAIASTPTPTGRNPLTFHSDAEGHLLCWQGRPVWHIDPDGRTLRYRAATSFDEPDRRTQLLWVVPHLLRLRNRSVLHASAVARANGVRAFCGSSGLGKTTLARGLARHGWQAIAEDLVVLELAGDRPEVVRDGELALRTWAEKETVRLQADVAISTEPLDAIFEGPRLPLNKILFLRRTASVLEIEEPSLGRADALVLLMENSFAELDRRDLWRQLWRENVCLASTVPMAHADLPEGLALLEAAIALQAARS